jgi:hypothetical protein
MNLTKRLYRLDEVRAALLFCLKCRRFNESIFWLRELEESFYGGEARRLLLVSWIMNIGLSRLVWLHEWSKYSGEREGRLRLCWQLLRCSERDSSLWWLLWSGVVPMKYETSSLVDRWNNICSLEDFWDKIDPHPCLDALQKDMKAYDIFARVVACSLSCKVPAPSMAVMSTEEPIDLRKTISEWDSLSIRKGRVYTIPYGCLYGMTMRGNGDDTSDEINAFTMTESPYWRRIVEFYTKDGAWISDDAKEMFFDKYFPEDIPDEWSLAEKRLSHGPGVTNGGTLARWWSAWICENHMWIWGDSICRIYEWVKGQPADSCIDKLCKLYSERKYQIMSKREPKSITKRRKVWVFE